MKPVILKEKIWPKVTAEAEANASHSFVAVAFFSTGAASMLPLQKGSALVVNASNAVVKSGQTNPHELIKLLKQGVRIYSCDNLHAKIFVLGNKLFIGSANVSQNSENDLQEVMLLTADKKLVKQAKRTINSFCEKDLGLEQLKQLSKIYHPPKFIGGILASKKRNTQKRTSGFYVCNLVYKAPPKGTEETYDKASKKAENKLSDDQHQLLDFWWAKKLKFKIGDIVFMIIDDKKGDHDIYPPGIIIQMDKFKKDCYFIFLEAPNKRIRKLSKLSKKMDITPLKRGGYKNEEIAKKVLKVWNQ